MAESVKRKKGFTGEYRHENYFLIELCKGVLKLGEDGRLYRIKCRSNNGKSKKNKPIDQKMPNGYMNAMVTINKKVHHIYMHRLIWFLHHGIIPEGKEINHKDGKKTNNRIENLELVTPSENMKHSYDHNLRGRNWEHSNAHLTREEYVTIDNLLKAGKNIKAIAQLLGHNWKTVNRIKKSIEEGVLEK